MRISIALLIAAVVLAAAAPPPPVALTITPRKQFEPGYLRMRVQVETHPDNRIICIGYDGAGDAAESCWEVDAHAPRTTWKEFKGIGDGTYEAYVEVRGVGGRRYRATETFVVLPKGFG